MYVIAVPRAGTAVARLHPQTKLAHLQAASDLKRLIIVQGTYSTAGIVLGERRFPALAEREHQRLDRRGGRAP
jgi:hypothetical protein